MAVNFDISYRKPTYLKYLFKIISSITDNLMTFVLGCSLNKPIRYHLEALQPTGINFNNCWRRSYLNSSWPTKCNT